MTAKNIVFGAALAGAVMTAGTPAVGQVRPEPRSNVMVYDASTSLGGSQLGVRIEDTANGVRIGEVTSGGAADKAGLKEGDLVVEYDGERVRSARQLTRLVQETPEGRSVKIAIQRNGQRQAVDATPDARTLAWHMDFDGDQIRREIERGMQGMPREFNFRMDDRMPGGARLATPRARLGVSVQSLSPQLADFFGAKDGGALVSSVTRDSAADKAGIKAGDVITSVDGDHVGGADALTSEIADKSGTVSIGILREKKPSTVKVTIQ